VGASQTNFKNNKMINQNNYDMWIALAFCYLPIIALLIMAYKASKSGSLVKEPINSRGGYKWVKSDVNVPFVKTGWFQLAIVWFVLGSVFFWLILWPDHHDIWLSK
jgi:hypothetical protein